MQVELTNPVYKAVSSAMSVNTWHRHNGLRAQLTIFPCLFGAAMLADGRAEARLEGVWCA